MLSQIGQKKKKEAVRRLSHGSTSSTSSRGTVRTSHDAEHWHQERKYSDKHKMQRRPGPIPHRPIKRRHISPLDRGHCKGTVDQQDTSNIPGLDFVGFNTVRSSDSPSVSQSTTSTTKSTQSMASTFSVSTAGVFQPVSSLQQSRGVVTTSEAFATAFGMVAPSSSTPAFNRLQGLSSGSIASHGVNPVFGTSFNAKSESTCTETLPASSSSFFSIGGFGKVTTPSSGLVFSTASFNTGAVSDTVTSIPFKQCGTFPSFVDTDKESKTTAVGSLSSNLSSATELLPMMMPASSNFTATRTDKQSTTAYATLGQAGAAATPESEVKGDSEVLFQEKTKGITIALLTSLVIKDIPENCNKNAWLKRFYSRFGEVTKVVCNPSKKSATVTFKTHEAADAAKKRGKILRPGLPPVTIFWKQGNRRSTSERDQQPLHNLESSTIPKSQEETTEHGKKTGSTFEQKTSRRSKTSEMLGDIEEYIQSLQACQNAGEKQQVLEEIDKKLRQVVKKPSDISTAEAVMGTCKDMCPEKERYTRECQRRLSVFESIPGTGSIDENPQVDHSRAVKEYDRSAADKEEPLPHELRPVPALRMTMDYLATNIMDAGQGREGEWFDFLWNRTRGIRKDITQQHLCDPDCVDLVEKTARFHIFCAHFLCETDISSFDAKINTENLTKCLQTLKQFYGDLHKDKGITCPMEAEFRAYDILLNLNEGDILREVMTFRDEIQRSPDVRFSMAVFHALNSNNFVRFFRLLRNASYLNACLLHRYFNQVRSKAVQTLNHSLSISNRTTSFPLKDLVETLAFENESEAGDFCTFHGLPISEGCVVFSRSSFIEPETRFAQKRAWGLIESKRNVSVGEVVYSGPLPPPPQHLPSLSFNGDGLYVGNTQSLLSAILKEDISSSQPVENHQSLASVEVKHEGRPGTEVSVSTRSAETSRISHKQVSMPSSVSLFVTPSSAQQTFTQLPEVTPKATEVYTGEEIVTFTKNLFLEVMNEMFAEITKEAFDKVHSFLRLSVHFADNILKETSSEVVKETAESLLQDEIYKKRIAEEKTASHQRVSLFVQGDVMKELVSRECARLVQEVVREVQEELLEIARAKACQEICYSLIEEGACRELQELISEVVNEEKAERDARLHQLALRIMKARTAQYFKRWLKVYQTSVHVKGLLSTFPPGAPMLSPEEQLRHLVGHTRAADIKVSVIRTEAEQAKIHKTLKQRLSDLERIRRQVCKPLDIPSLLAEELGLQPDACAPETCFAVYWKLVISFPESCNTNNAVSFVIKEKFKRGPYPLETHIPQPLQNKVDLLSLYRAEVRASPNRTKVFGICVKACCGELTNTQQRQAMETRQFHGASAVMFVVDGQELQFTSQAVRLRHLLESKPPVPALPVAIVVIDDNTADLPEDMVFSFCEVQELRTKGLLSECKVWRISSLDHAQSSTRTVASMVTWFGRHLPSCSVPRMDSLVNFIEDGLQREFTTPVGEDLYLRRKAKLEPQCPEAIIELFNSVLEHLAAVVSSSTLQQLSWPISEFSGQERHKQGLPVASWNSTENRRRLQELILSLKLPPPPPPAVDGAWKSESGLCLNYARGLARDTASLINRVQWILDRTRRSLQDVNFLSVSSRLSASKVPWPLVLEACVNFKLTSLHVDPGLAEMDVYYSLEELEKFVPPTLWRRSMNLSKEESAVVNNKCRHKMVTPENRKDSRIQEAFHEVESKLEELSESLSPETRKTSHVTLSAAAGVTPCSSSIQVASEQLKSALQEAKTESARFEELLKNVLSDGNTPWNQFRNSARRKRKAQSLGEFKKSPRFSEGFDLPTMNTSVSSLEDRLSCLNESIKSQRRSDQFTERRLLELLET